NKQLNNIKANITATPNPIAILFINFIFGDFIFTALSIFIPFNYNLFIFLIKLYHILIIFASFFAIKCLFFRGFNGFLFLFNYVNF
ncbi:hypothetical protein EIY03_05890, partial [Campylobacter jejuni]|nr:hypothetical protein [Campylobacter jejuni]